MDRPLFSVILPVYDPPIDVLAATLDSLAGQRHDRFEVLVVDDSSTRPEVAALLDERTRADSRFELIRRPTNGGIAAATNDGLDRATGDFVVFCDHDDLVHANALSRIADHIVAHPDVDVVYTDEQQIDSDGRVTAEYRKPAYSPVRMSGQNYFNHLVAVRRSVVGSTRIRAGHEPAQDWDFLLRVLPNARHVGHVPEILYSWRAIDGSTALDAAEKPEVFDAARRTAQAALDRAGHPAHARNAHMADGTPTGSITIAWTPASGDVTAMIPIDATSTSAGVNAAIDRAGADVVTLVAAGTRPDPGAIDALLAEAARPEVGAAGPLLIDDTGRLSSAGRVLRPVLEDRFQGIPGDNVGPWASFLVTREVSALAPDGFTIRTADLAAVGGLAEDVGLDLSVAEACVGLRLRGTPTVCTPNATFRQQDPTALDPVSISRDQDVVRSRCPAIDDEEYATDGRGSPRYRGLAPVRQLEQLIERHLVDVITCDVFDTLVTRRVATPADLFLGLGERLRELGMLPPHVTPRIFAGARRLAEEKARRENRRRPEDGMAEISPECTIEEIYAQLPGEGRSTGVSIEQLVALELEAEVSALAVVTPMAAALTHAHEVGIRTVLVSDTYLSADQLEALLADVGVDLGAVDRIVTSSDQGLGKADGLLEIVVDEECDRRDRVAHVGDNELADVRTAERLGVVAIAAEVVGDDRHLRTIDGGIKRLSTTAGSDGGISAAVRATLIGSELLTDPAHQFGAAVAGPAFAGFAAWASASARELGATSVSCLLREGAVIADLMQLMAPDGPTPLPLHASRWVVARAAVLDGTLDELSVAAARRRPLDADHVVAAFGIDRQRLIDAVGSGPWDLHGTVRALEAISEDDDLRSQVIASSADLRARLLQYLDAAMDLGGEGPLVLCDIGWGGTIQDGLTKVLRSAGVERHVTGLYFALSAPGEDRLAAGADMRSYLPNRHDDPVAARWSRTVAHNADIAERLLTPRLGTLIDIDAEGRPVCRPDTDERIPPSLAVAQAAVGAAATNLSRLPAAWTADRHWFGEPAVRVALAEEFAEAIVSPTPAVATTLSEWPHDDVAGTHVRSIAPAETAQLVRYLGAADIDKIGWTETSWPEGMAAAVNPVLSAQLAAVARGVDAGELCPTAATGPARLAVFEAGSALARAQAVETPTLGPDSWALLRVSTEVGSVRSVRFDAGDVALLAEMAELVVVIEDERGARTRVEVDDLRDQSLVWVDAHPFDRTTFAAAPGGHLIVPIDPGLGATARALRAHVAFRSRVLDASSPLLAPPLQHRVATVRRRAGGLAGRVRSAAGRSTP